MCPGRGQTATNGQNILLEINSFALNRERLASIRSPVGPRDVQTIEMAEISSY